jgi:CRISPR-associated protein Csh1
MIQQFRELGEHFVHRDAVSNDLARYAQNPALKARGNTVVVLVFSERGFEDVRIEEYDDSHRLRYLYRPGPANGWDATSTTRMPNWDRQAEGDACEAIAKRVKRITRSAGEALDRFQGVPAWENQALNAIKAADPQHVAQSVLLKYSEPKGQATLTVAWQTPGEQLRYVGDFEAYRQNLVRHGWEAASKKKTTGEVKGVGVCSICGQQDVEVLGMLQIPNFKFYTPDKRGSVSGGFDPTMAWRNFPACRQCSESADYSGERVKKELSFDYYGFKYLVLPSPVAGKLTGSFDFLGRLVSARLAPAVVRRLTDAEEELFFAISEEQDLLQVDLLFYAPDPNYFRPALYVSGLLPSRFRVLFDAKDKVDAHPWLKPPFAKGEFTFKAVRDVFPSSRNRGTFDDDFLRATRAALELGSIPDARVLSVGMRWVRQDFVERGNFWGSLSALFRTLFFFEVLTQTDARRGNDKVQINYGASEQANRVRRLFSDSTGKLGERPEAQAAFLVGACCRRIEFIQLEVRKATPFVGKYKGLRLVQGDVQRLFVEAKAKAQDYGPEQEDKVRELLTCAAAALAATPDRWELSPDEVSYFFALGHALAGRLAKEHDQDDAQGGSAQ